MENALDGVRQLPRIAGGQVPRKNNLHKFTADGDTREGSQGTRTVVAITRNEPLEHDPLEPSATFSADVLTREDGKFKSDSGNAGNLESATTATIYSPMGAGQLGHKTYHAFVNQHPEGEHIAPRDQTIAENPADKVFTSISFISSKT